MMEGTRLSMESLGVSKQEGRQREEEVAGRPGFPGRQQDRVGPPSLSPQHQPIRVEAEGPVEHVQGSQVAGRGALQGALGGRSLFPTVLSSTAVCFLPTRLAGKNGDRSRRFPW